MMILTLSSFCVSVYVMIITKARYLISFQMKFSRENEKFDYNLHELNKEREAFII